MSTKNFACYLCGFLSGTGGALLAGAAVLAVQNALWNANAQRRAAAFRRQRAEDVIRRRRAWNADRNRSAQEEIKSRKAAAKREAEEAEALKMIQNYNAAVAYGERPLEYARERSDGA